MIVLVDTTIWSLALRRRPARLSASERKRVGEWEELVRQGRAVLMGPIRQEVLSGIREPTVFDALRRRLADFRHLGIEPDDYDQAAVCFNRLRSRGVAGTPVDMLICAVASRHRVPIFTTDRDFELYATHLEIALHPLGPATGPA
jgi:predicted nucleic acid-binding protein